MQARNVHSTPVNNSHQECNIPEALQNPYCLLQFRLQSSSIILEHLLHFCNWYKCDGEF